MNPVGMVFLSLALMAQGVELQPTTDTNRADGVTVSAGSAVGYLLSCQKANGAFGPPDQEYTDLAWTYPAVHALHLLGESVPRPEDCYLNGVTAFDRTPFWSRYQLEMLGRILRANEYSPPKASDLSCDSLHSLWCESVVRGFPVGNRKEALAYVLARQKRDGSFVDGDLGSVETRTSHVVWTFYAIAIAESLNSDRPHKAACIEWLKSCQAKSGGFRWSPIESVHANYEDVWYAWAAVLALKSLDAEPNDVEKCIDWVNALQSADGGFADKPGWRSRLYSTYYAVHILHALTGDATSAIRSKTVAARSPAPIAKGKYRIFQAHSKSPPGGPEMVDAVHEMGIDLVGVKAYPHEMTDAYAYAKQRRLPVTLLSNPEFYPHQLRFLDGRSGNHVANFMIPLDLSETDRAIYASANSVGQQDLTWPEYQNKVIAPMMKLGTLFWPEWDAGRAQWGMLDAYLSYDDGVFGRPGYNAVHAASKLAGQDRIRLYPWRERYVGLLPFIADCDAHGDIRKYAPALNLYRNIYIAKTNSFEDYLDASLNGRSVCVLRTEDVPSGIVYYGAPAAVDYIKRHQNAWKWW